MRVLTSRQRFVATLAAGALVLSACGGGNDTASDTTTGDGATTTAGGPTTTTQPAATGDPVNVGLINMEDTPAGSFPELRIGAEAAVGYINNQLGGIDGHPIELETCKTGGTPEDTQACANQLVEANVPVVIAGQDFQMSVAYPIFQQAGIPVVGITPTTPADFTAQGAYYFSGGSFTNLFGLVQFIGDYLEVKKVAVLFQDDAAGQAAVPLVTPGLDKLGIEYTTLGEKVDAPDYTPMVAAVQAENVDAILVLFAAHGCTGIMKARASLMPDVPIITTGACYNDEVTSGAGDAADNTYFSLGPNPEDPTSSPDMPAYLAAMAEYAPDADIAGLGGAGFSDVMTLWEVLAGVGYDSLTTTGIADALKSTKDGHLFLGQPWTCGQVAALPAVCETHIRVYRYEGGKLEDATDGKWVEGMSLFG